MNPIEKLGDFMERNVVLGYPFGKMRSSVKGQTALEYLLIIVVALIVVIAIFLWVQGTSNTAQNEANTAVGNLFNTLRSAT